MSNQRSLGIAAALGLAALASAQAPAAPAFEVATIRPAPPFDPMKLASGQMRVGVITDAGRVEIGSLSLADLIRTAYRIKPYQLSGPDWMRAQRWDVTAKIPDGVSAGQMPEMLQALLADRFRLVVHRSSTEHPVYALVAAKGGPKMKEAEPDPPAPAAAEPDAPGGRGGFVFGNGDSQVRVTPNAGGRGANVSSPKFGQMKVGAAEAGAMRMEFSKMKMPDLADMLAQFLDRPVLDMTGLTGSYQVALELGMEDMMNVARASGMGALMGPGPGPNPARAPADASSPGSSLFTAVQQLGLRLDARKAPLDMIVVDHLEKTPTEN